MQSPTETMLDAIAVFINDSSETTRHLIKELSDTIETEFKKNPTLDTGANRFLHSVLNGVIQTGVSVENKQERLLLLSKMQGSDLAKNNQALLKTLNKLFDCDEAMTTRTLTALRTKLRNTQLWYISQNAVKKLFGKLQASTASSNIDQQSIIMDEIQTYSQGYIEQFTHTRSLSDTMTMERIDTSSLESLEFAFKKNVHKRKTSVLKLGWQCINKALGGAGCMVGESLLIHALSHNYKSGLLKKFAKWIPEYNTPPPELEGDPYTKGKPCVLFVTLENEAHENLYAWFVDIYGVTNNVTPAQIREMDLSPAFMSAYIYEFFNRNGYVLHIERVQGGIFTVDDCIAMYDKYTRSGWNVVALIVDYMSQMKHRTDAGRPDLALGDTATRLCQHTRDRATTLITAHQLNRDAYILANSNEVNVVKKFGPQHISGSLEVERGFDFSMVLHIERNQYGIPYLTGQRWKHRHHDDTPIAHRYWAREFTEWGIPDDIEGPDLTITNIYAVEDPNAEENLDDSVFLVEDAF